MPPWSASGSSSYEYVGVSEVKEIPLINENTNKQGVPVYGPLFVFITKITRQHGGFSRIFIS
jgi:hypothetical protein